EIYDNLAEETGIQTFGVYDTGFRNIGNNVHPITKPEDMKDLKLRTTNSPMNIDNLEIFGASPVTMEWSEAFTAIQQGTVDGLDQTITLTSDDNVYEVIDYYTLTEVWFGSTMISMSGDAWE